MSAGEVSTEAGIDTILEVVSNVLWAYRQMLVNDHSLAQFIVDNRVFQTVGQVLGAKTVERCPELAYQNADLLNQLNHISNNNQYSITMTVADFKPLIAVFHIWLEAFSKLVEEPAMASSRKFPWVEEQRDSEGRAKLVAQAGISHCVPAILTLIWEREHGDQE